MSKDFRLKGMTLFEILIVISIIGILFSLGSSSYNSAQDKQKRQRTKVQLKLIQNALEDYFLEEREYPKGNGDIKSSSIVYASLYGDRNYDGIAEGEIYLPNLNPEEGKMVMKQDGEILIKDAYGQPIRYRTGENAIHVTFDLWSIGENKKSEIDSEAVDIDDILY